jgi:hypothetical protein
MRFEAIIIIEDDNGSLKSEFGLIVDICKNKKVLISKLKEQLQDVLDHEHKEHGLSISDFEFKIYEDLTEKYKDV